ncbi:hypothetical protein [Mangrovibacillus cuniculi]|uniref:Uncharacterized protein n=1 Tax=Mangrovibacillus cuniculi TaxID=2593652 RepID=A0A7S8HGB0_9BACI|nr:hypothetical protein [Mangrovibacillus cuniculi]QPC47617.1 hypothetical protein G8O30_11970 [Mangrovibacillus cuniculi]
MNINYTSNIIEIFFLLLSWGIVAYLAYRIQKKQTEKIKVWKIFVIIYIGLFCFSFNYTVDTELIRIPLLPLGVWILYFIWRKDQTKWEKYRRFAWLGFWSNLIFLTLGTVAMFVYPVMYANDNPSTFISKLDDPTILSIYMNVEEVELDEQNFLATLAKMKPAHIYSDKWYREAFEGYENPDKQERFPYLLEGAKGKWGSGVNSAIYIEKDGKGIYVATSKGHYYFRSEVSLLVGEKNE